MVLVSHAARQSALCQLVGTECLMYFSGSVDTADSMDSRSDWSVGSPAAPSMLPNRGRCAGDAVAFHRVQSKEYPPRANNIRQSRSSSNPNPNPNARPSRTLRQLPHLVPTFPIRPRGARCASAHRGPASSRTALHPVWLPREER